MCTSTVVAASADKERRLAEEDPTRRDLETCARRLVQLATNSGSFLVWGFG
ncbi:MAG: hypothetical protein IPP96_17325 [Chitinophagaceae bacterium]|nr:hypothetical protein [Chitinophagaceae bacterium]